MFCILVPYAFYLGTVRFLMSVAFWGAALFGDRRLLDGSVYSDLSVNGAALIRGNTVPSLLYLVNTIE